MGGNQGDPPNSPGTNNWLFIDRDGNTHQKYFDVPTDSGPGSEINERIFNDTVVYKLRDDEPGFIESNISIVEKIADLYSLPENTNYPLYGIDNQGKFWCRHWFNPSDNFPKNNIDSVIDGGSTGFTYPHSNIINSLKATADLQLG